MKPLQSAWTALVLLVPSALSLADSTRPCIIWPLGDSITLGTNVPGGYRAPLFQSLLDAGYQIRLVGSSRSMSASVLTESGNDGHDGHGGYPSFSIAANLDGGSNSSPASSAKQPASWLVLTPGHPANQSAIEPDIILLMAGTNDLGMYQHSPEQLLADYEALLEKLIRLRPSAAVIASTLIPYNGKPVMNGRDYSQREARQLAFNKALPNLVEGFQARGKRVFFFDMRRFFSVENAAALLSEDGVHPNQLGYNAIAQGWLTALKEHKLLIPASEASKP